MIDHDIELQLRLAEQTLVATDHMTLTDSTQHWPHNFNLSPNAQIDQVLADQKPIAYKFHQGTLTLSSLPQKVSKLTLKYRAVFNDPVPKQTVGIEDPSYGIEATIASSGVFLSQSARWSPSASGYMNRYRIRVDAEPGLIAVTDGKLISIDHTEKHTRTTWQTVRPQQGLTLVAGFYQVKRLSLGETEILTFFSSDNAMLADRYLNACREYLELYQELFGPYPYAKFAVVENFFPTGYGLPGWTLLGSSVIRLPFILTSSLPHEIAHAWWGNAIEVDYTQGNWCEGLATYVADYLLKERRSPQEAREYRLKMLRDYAALVKPDNNYPLKNFRSRTSKRDQAIGYGKTAMVYHMLRQQIGDQAFWGGLRRIAQQENGNTIGWNALRDHFEAVSNQDLNNFFKQWIEQAGAPEISLKETRVEQTPEGWQVQGVIVQHGETYQLQIPLLIENVKGLQAEIIAVKDRETPFNIQMSSQPKRLSVDPETMLFRTLYPVEIPPTINALRASSNQLVVIARGYGENLLEPSRDLLRGLHWSTARVIDEQELTPVQLDKNDLLVLGQPQSELLRKSIPANVSVGQQSFSYDGKVYNKAEDALFLTLSKPDKRAGTIGIFYPLSAEAARLTARKISHYGRYSYLVFSAGRNQLKGTWPVTESPLIHNFNEDSRP